MHAARQLCISATQTMQWMAAIAPRSTRSSPSSSARTRASTLDPSSIRQAKITLAPLMPACFCGAVELTIAGHLVAMGYRHCESCRAWSARPVNAFTLWPECVGVPWSPGHGASRYEASARSGERENLVWVTMPINCRQGVMAASISCISQNKSNS